MSHWRYLPYGLHREPGPALEDVPVAVPVAIPVASRAFSSANAEKNLSESTSHWRLPAHSAWLVAAYSHVPDQLLCAQMSSTMEST